jgi:hypothetical protein
MYLVSVSLCLISQTAAHTLLNSTDLADQLLLPGLLLCPRTLFSIVEERTRVVWFQLPHARLARNETR